MIYINLHLGDAMEKQFEPGERRGGSWSGSPTHSAYAIAGQRGLDWQYHWIRANRKTDAVK